MSRKSKKKTGLGKAVAARFNPSVPPSGKRDWIFALVLVLAVIIAYQPVWHAGFIWDDDSWTTGISGLLRNLSGLRLMWSDPTALQQYYPLSGTTFWLDYHLWGFWTPPYHVENILLQAIAALLFWKLLQKLEVPGAWLAAGIFALHPVMVESVAWVTERKNVFSMVFFLGALLAYGRFNSFWKADNDSRRKWGAYALAFLLFLLALLAKTTTLSFPAVIVLIGWWKNGRIQWRRDVLPALPFFVLAVGLSLMTAWLEKNHVGATGSNFAMTFLERLLVAGRAPWFYLGKLFWPENLCFIYPRWKPDAGSWWQWFFPMAALAALAALWLGRKKTGRGPAAAAFFFVGTLFPVLGFMSAYGMLYSFVWNHWVYLSSLGLMALSASVIVQTTGRLRWPPAVSGGFAAALLIVLAVLTWRQCGMYADAQTLWQTTIRQNPNCSMAHNNLGNLLFEKGWLDEAIIHFQKALQIDPENSDAYFNLGNALISKGEIDEAIDCYQKALQLNPNYSEAFNNLGYAYFQKGNLGESAVYFRKAQQFNPDNAQACYNLGNVLLKKGDVDEAMSHLQRSLQINPENADAYYDLGEVALQKGNVDQAIVYFQSSLQIHPGLSKAQDAIADCLRRQQDPHAAKQP